MLDNHNCFLVWFIDNILVYLQNTTYQILSGIERSSPGFIFTIVFSQSTDIYQDWGQAFSTVDVLVRRFGCFKTFHQILGCLDEHHLNHRGTICFFFMEVPISLTFEL